MGRAAVAALACAGALVASGCSTPSASSTPKPLVVDVAMTEYRFDHDVRPRAGRVVFRARNLGRIDHELLLVRVPEDFPPILEQLRSDTRRPVKSLAQVARREPGATGTFAVDLAPGRYAMICFVADADGEQHSRKGMAAEFRVGDAPPAGSGSTTTTAPGEGEAGDGGQRAG